MTKLVYSTNSLNEDELKRLKVEYLINRLLDHTTSNGRQPQSGISPQRLLDHTLKLKFL